jgi:hypothetical protein
MDRLDMSLEDLPCTEDGEFALDSLWIPHNGDARPFHVQVMCTTYVDELVRPLAYSAGFSLYVPVESSPENRIIFSEEELDIFGLPRITVHAEYSTEDTRMIDRGRVFLADLARTLGTFDPDTESALLPAGTALHQTGTVPAGSRNDGTSVCDDEGRVWDMSNVFVAGTAVIPTSMACNTTLTGVVSAVRAGRRIGSELARSDRERR